MVCSFSHDFRNSGFDNWHFGTNLKQCALSQFSHLETNLEQCIYDLNFAAFGNQFNAV